VALTFDLLAVQVVPTQYFVGEHNNQIRKSTVAAYHLFVAYTAHLVPCLY